MQTHEAIIHDEEIPEIKSERVHQNYNNNGKEIKENSMEQHKVSLMRTIVDRRDPSAKVSIELMCVTSSVI